MRGTSGKWGACRGTSSRTTTTRPSLRTICATAWSGKTRLHSLRCSGAGTRRSRNSSNTEIGLTPACRARPTTSPSRVKARSSSHSAATARPTIRRWMPFWPRSERCAGPFRLCLTNCGTGLRAQVRVFYGSNPLSTGCGRTAIISCKSTSGRWWQSRRPRREWPSTGFSRRWLSPLPSWRSASGLPYSWQTGSWDPCAS